MKTIFLTAEINEELKQYIFTNTRYIRYNPLRRNLLLRDNNKKIIYSLLRCSYEIITKFIPKISEYKKDLESFRIESKSEKYEVLESSINI